MHYTCPKPGCPFTSNVPDNIDEILKHEKTHPKENTVVNPIIREKCNFCNGKGYVEYEVKEGLHNVSKTD